MNVDSDIAPLLEKMGASMETIREELLPMLAKLDEDTLVSHYSVEEQARLSLSAAFAIAFSLYSLDKLQNKQHAHVANVVGQSMSPTTDAQLVLKIERITDYIKKLREITLLQHQQQQQAQQQQPEGAQGAPTSASAAKPGTKRRGHSAEDGADQPHKAAKTEASAGTASKTADDDAASPEDNLGDAEMFSVVSRIPGETGTAVSRLIHQAQAANTVSKQSV